MPITVTITGTSIGTDAGPFNIYHTSVDSANQLGSMNYTRPQILAGLTFNNIPDGTNDFYIVSSGICGNTGTANLTVPTNAPTAAPTPSPTTAPTAAPVTPSPTAAPTAAPVTPAPVTPAPTAAPVTPAPVTPAPVTAEPTMAPTAAPVTPAPVTPAPVTPEPTAAPVTPSPTYSAPVTSPVTPAPVTPAPVTPAPTVTPAPIPTSTYEYWYADVYDCSDCNSITETIVVANDLNNPAIIPNRYYQAASGPNGFTYRCTSEAPEGSAFQISSIWGAFNTCAIGCQV